MKKLIVIALAAAFLVACKKNNAPTPAIEDVYITISPDSSNVSYAFSCAHVDNPLLSFEVSNSIKNTYQLQAIPGEELHVIYQFSVDNQPQGTGHISFVINKDTVQKFSGNSGNTTFYLPKN